jgi:hypothetical protein
MAVCAGHGDQVAMRDFSCLSFFEACISPPLPQPLSTPAGAERGANSRIWPCSLRWDVQAQPGAGLGDAVHARGSVGPNKCRSEYLCHNAPPQPAFALQQPTDATRCASHLQKRINVVQPARKLGRTQQDARPTLKNAAKYGCWLPLSPGGARQGGGSEWGKNPKNHPTKFKPES